MKQRLADCVNPGERWKAVKGHSSHEQHLKDIQSDPDNNQRMCNSFIDYFKAKLTLFIKLSLASCPCSPPLLPVVLISVQLLTPSLRSRPQKFWIFSIQFLPNLLLSISYQLHFSNPVLGFSRFLYPTLQTCLSHMEPSPPCSNWRRSLLSLKNLDFLPLIRPTSALFQTRIRFQSSLVRPYVPSRALRSSSAHQLCVPHVSTVFGLRGFRSASPAIWNSLPLLVKPCSTIHTFKKQLMTHLFASAFPSS